MSSILGNLGSILTGAIYGFQFTNPLKGIDFGMGFGFQLKNCFVLTNFLEVFIWSVRPPSSYRHGGNPTQDPNPP